MELLEEEEEGKGTEQEDKEQKKGGHAHYQARCTHGLFHMPLSTHSVALKDLAWDR